MKVCKSNLSIGRVKISLGGCGGLWSCGHLCHFGAVPGSRDTRAAPGGWVRTGCWLLPSSSLPSKRVEGLCWNRAAPSPLAQAAWAAEPAHGCSEPAAGPRSAELPGQREGWHPSKGLSSPAISPEPPTQAGSGWFLHLGVQTTQQGTTVTLLTAVRFC